MKYLVCDFSGWFKIDVNDVLLRNCTTNEVKTAAEWLKIQDDLEDLILEDFNDANSKALDGMFENLDLEIESD